MFFLSMLVGVKSRPSWVIPFVLGPWSCYYKYLLNRNPCHQLDPFPRVPASPWAALSGRK